MPRWFTAQELSVLDDLTANNKAVLASLGGRPANMKEYAEENDDDEDLQMRGAEGVEPMHTDEKSDLHRRRSCSAVSQRMGSITWAMADKMRSHSRVGEREPVMENNDEKSALEEEMRGRLSHETVRQRIESITTAPVHKT
jgi:hypothetical protein